MMILAAFGLFLGGCGQKGDLYLPDSEATAEEEEKKENTD